MRQRGLAAHIPTATRVRTIWVDDDEAVLLGSSLVRGAVEVGLRSTGAVVDCDDDARTGGEFLRYVDVKASFRGCATKGRYLREGARGRSATGEGRSGGKGQ